MEPELSINPPGHGNVLVPERNDVLRLAILEHGEGALVEVCYQPLFVVHD